VLTSVNAFSVKFYLTRTRRKVLGNHVNTCQRVNARRRTYTRCTRIFNTSAMDALYPGDNSRFNSPAQLQRTKEVNRRRRFADCEVGTLWGPSIGHSEAQVFIFGMSALSPLKASLAVSGGPFDV